MVERMLRTQYGVKALSVEPMTDHQVVRTYRVETDKGTYVLKTVPPHVERPEQEGELTAFLLGQGIPVQPIQRTVRGKYTFVQDGTRYHLQPFAQGEVLPINAAPDWFLDQSAQMLGRIQRALSAYPRLGGMFEPVFFSPAMPDIATESYAQTLQAAKRAGHARVVRDVEDRMALLPWLQSLAIDPSRITYANSHGDYYISQIIVNGRDLTVIDWTDAAYLPACWEVIMSYTYADPACKEGAMDADRLRAYVDAYAAHHPLGAYDLEIMPALYAYQLGMCDYFAPFPDIAPEHLEIAFLATNLLRTLHDRAGALSRALVR